MGSRGRTRGWEAITGGGATGEGVARKSGGRADRAMKGRDAEFPSPMDEPIDPTVEAIPRQ